MTDDRSGEDNDDDVDDDDGDGDGDDYYDDDWGAGSKRRTTTDRKRDLKRKGRSAHLQRIKCHEDEQVVSQITVADGPVSPGKSGDEEEDMASRYIGDDDDDDDGDDGLRPGRCQWRTTIDRKQSRK